uniref:Ankyrin-1 n=1 Tax=Triticum urartu TaxID=4572 RepID=A0A8R7U298_TRIUA
MEDMGPLHEAACTGKIETCQYLVEQLGFDINTEANDDSGMTPLACAVLRDKSVTMEYLLDKGANPNKQDNKRFTPLHYATKEGNNRLVRLLLSKGASVDVLSSEGTPLHVAASYGKSGIIQILLQHNADPNTVSADLGTPMAAVLCVASGRITESDALKCMKLLVKAGADLNCANPDTPLVIATSKDLSECVEYLLEVGADANIPSNQGRMIPIEMAANSGRRKLVEILFPFTLPIQSVSNWSVEGIIAHEKLRQSNKGKQSDKDSNVQLKLNAEVTTNKEDSGAPKKPCAKDKGGDKDKKAEMKLLGAKAVERKDYAAALKFYSEAIKVDPEDATLYSNRSLCHLKSGEAHDALADAIVCVNLQPDWAKGYYRKGAALMSLKESKEACDAFLAGGKLNPASVEIHDAFWEAIEAMKKQHSDRQSAGPV